MGGKLMFNFVELIIHLMETTVFGPEAWYPTNDKFELKLD